MGSEPPCIPAGAWGPASHRIGCDGSCELAIQTTITITAESMETVVQALKAEPTQALRDLMQPVDLCVHGCGNPRHVPFWSCWSKTKIRRWHDDARRKWPDWYRTKPLRYRDGPAPVPDEDVVTRDEMGRGE